MRKLVVPSVALSMLAACGEEGGTTVAPGAGSDDVLSVVEPGKEDNFLSQTAQEYLLTGTTTVVLEAEWAGRSFEERLQRARELVPYRQTVIGWFLNAYMVEKSSHDSNQSYGGFKALTKNGSWEDLDLREVDELTFAFDFRQEIAGPLNLLSVLPTQVATDGTRTFDLVIGKISTAEMLKLETNSEWYRKSPWSGFNPDQLSDAQKETVNLTIAAEPRSADAWFDYAPLIEDGVLDIGVHFGWDYHDAYHIKHSEATYDWLVARGFKSPVGSYAELAHDSGPLTKDMLTPLGPVQMKVSLYWGKPGTATDPDTNAGGRQLEADMLESLKSRDVIMYSGHSGPFYAFALANWRMTDEGDLDDSEIPDVEMPERYQVVLAEGCDTYAIGQAFFANPAKRDRKNIDIITTTSFSNASTSSAVTDFLSAFVGKGSGEDLTALPRLTELLTDLDTNSSWFATMYGVHGIDDNPHVHPFAKTENLCDSCQIDADCGGVGNSCVRLADGKRACTYECTTDEACGEGFLCQAAQSGGWIRQRVCVTQQATCEVKTEAPVVVKISQVVPNPDSDLNGDGEVDVRDDEMVELKNAGAGAVDLSGWSLADNVGVRYTFPGGFILEAGATVQVFGGGGG
ncbi:MAG: lamin tail domain-containing protein, partial [Myxococcales bacterium]|nr:lamin tail domain-containing protein [Myxococcales bacterium]